VLQSWLLFSSQHGGALQSPSLSMLWAGHAGILCDFEFHSASPQQLFPSSNHCLLSSRPSFLADFLSFLPSLTNAAQRIWLFIFSLLWSRSVRNKDCPAAGKKFFIEAFWKMSRGRCGTESVLVLVVLAGLAAVGYAHSSTGLRLCTTSSSMCQVIPIRQGCLCERTREAHAGRGSRSLVRKEGFHYPPLGMLTHRMTTVQNSEACDQHAVSCWAAPSGRRRRGRGHHWRRRRNQGDPHSGRQR
jgi:hypothetical protein